MNYPRRRARCCLRALRITDGLILRLTATEGSAFLKTNGRAFSDGTPGDQARWERGVLELTRLGLIEPQGARVLRITAAGYKAADLRRRGAE